jgi:hypothetical protein
MCHAFDPAVGRVETANSSPAPITHNLGEAHEIDTPVGLAKTRVRFHARRPPAGFADVMTSPVPLAIAQKVVVGQLMAEA